MNCVKTLLIITLIPLFYSCEYIDSINKTGKVISTEISLNEFDKIDIESPYNIVLIQDTLYYIYIEGMDYLVDDIIIEQTDNTIKLNHKTPGIIQKKKMPHLYIHSKHFSSITSNSPGELTNVDTLREKTLSVVINGRGTYFDSNLCIDTESFLLRAFGEINTGIHTISGKTLKASFIMEGCTYALAEDLQSDHADFTHKSAADCTVTTNKTLNVIIYSSGNLLYKGTPEITFTRGESSMLNSTGKLKAIQK